MWLVEVVNANNATIRLKKKSVLGCLLSREDLNSEFSA